MPEENRPSNPSAGPGTSTTHPANPPAHPIVNAWKPVTDLYQEELSNGPAPVVAAPPKPAPAPVSQPAPGYNTVPMSLNIITGFFFFQAVVYLAIAGPLISHPDSDFSLWVVANHTAIIPFALSYRHPELFVRLVGEACIFMAAVSAVVGGMWVFRSWKIRWVTMAYAGGRVLRAGVYYFAGVASGVASTLSPSAQAIVIVNCCINVLIFCYLAFYPGVKQAFEKQY